MFNNFSKLLYWEFVTFVVISSYNPSSANFLPFFSTEAIQASASLTFLKGKFPAKSLTSTWNPSILPFIIPASFIVIASVVPCSDLQTDFGIFSTKPFSSAIFKNLCTPASVLMFIALSFPTNSSIILVQFLFSAANSVGFLLNDWSSIKILKACSILVSLKAVLLWAAVIPAICFLLWAKLSWAFFNASFFASISFSPLASCNAFWASSTTFSAFLTSGAKFLWAPEKAACWEYILAIPFNNWPISLL